MFYKYLKHVPGVHAITATIALINKRNFDKMIKRKKTVIYTFL